MTWFLRRSEQPLWKEEFSVHTADERYVSRRQFSKFLVLTSLGMFVGNLWLLLKSITARRAVYPQTWIGTASAIPVGGVKLFTYPTAEDHCILVRLGPEQFVAYSQKCTHLSCAVYYSAERKQLLCPCHNGVFNVADGSVIAGPPPRSLPRIVIERRNDDLLARAAEPGENT